MSIADKLLEMSAENNTQAAKIAEALSLLNTKAAGGGGGGRMLKVIAHLELTEDVVPSDTAWTSFEDGSSFADITALYIVGKFTGASTSTVEGWLDVIINGEKSGGLNYGAQKAGNARFMAIMYEKKINRVWVKMTNICATALPPQALMFGATVSFVRFSSDTISTIGMSFPTAGAVGFGAGTDLYIVGEVSQ